MIEEQKQAVFAGIMINSYHPMAKFIDQIPTPPKEGNIIDGTIIALERGRVYVDLPPFGTGLIYGREYLNAADVLRISNVVDTITVKVVN